MILSQKSHTIYMSNLTMKLTQKMGLNLISTICNNETSVTDYTDQIDENVEIVQTDQINQTDWHLP